MFAAICLYSHSNCQGDGATTFPGVKYKVRVSDNRVENMYGGGDRDFNDVVVNVNIKVV